MKNSGSTVVELFPKRAKRQTQLSMKGTCRAGADAPKPARVGISSEKAQRIVSLFDRIRAEERLEYEQLLAAALAKDATGNLRRIEGYTRRQIAAAETSVRVLQSLRRAAGLPTVSTKFRS